MPFHGATVHPGRRNDDASVSFDDPKGGLVVGEPGRRRKIEKVGLLRQDFRVDVYEADNLQAIGEGRQKSTNPASGHAAGTDHQATLLHLH